MTTKKKKKKKQKKSAKKKGSFMKKLMKTDFFKKQHAGKVILKVAQVLSHPYEYILRKASARLVVPRKLNYEISEDGGYLQIDPYAVQGTKEVVDLCRKIYTEEKEPRLEEIWDGKSGKTRFLTELLEDEDLHKYPELVDYCLSKDLLHAATKYLGTVPVISRIGLWLASHVEDNEDLISSQLIHTDPEDFRQLKLFINVFDVEMENGPTTFLPADVSKKVMDGIWKNDKATEAKPHRYRRYTDTEVLDHCKESDYIKATGPAGSALFVDTARCLHFGSRLPPGKIRLLLHVQYLSYHYVRPTTFNRFDLNRYQDKTSRLVLSRRPGAYATGG